MKPIPVSAWLGCKSDCPIAWAHSINDWLFTAACTLLILVCLYALFFMVFR